MATSDPLSSPDATILALRKTLTSESESLARRFRALFSLKHLACQSSIPAIHAIAAAFTSPSALLKHELAYCLGQTRNPEAAPFLRAVLDNGDEDSMCRHEAAEALGALGDAGSLDILRRLRDTKEEVQVVRETCELAVARIEWENSEEGKAEDLRKRYVYIYARDVLGILLMDLIVTLHLSTLHPPANSPRPSRLSRKPSWTRNCLSSGGIEPCLASEISHRRPTFPPLSQPSTPWRREW
jgi:hypothetical protein